MTGNRCLECGKVTVNPPGRCVCGSERIESITLSGRGEVYSHTTLHTAAEPFEKDLPFQIAIIQLEEGPRLTARIEGEKVKVGDRVRQVAERDGIWFFSLAT